MRHEFTDEQLQLTILDASDQRSIFIRTARELEDIDSSAIQSLRTLLYHLPEQPGDDALREQAGLYKELIDHPFFRDWSISGTSVRSFMMNKLDSAMTPQDYWQECSWGDVLHTDARVKAEYISGTVIEGIPDGVSDDGIYIVDGNFIPFSTDARWYRIPTPVVHPHPLDHPAIVVIEADGYEDTNPQVFVRTGNRYENDAWSFDADDITSWKPIDPAKVVADND